MPSIKSNSESLKPVPRAKWGWGRPERPQSDGDDWAHTHFLYSFGISGGIPIYIALFHFPTMPWWLSAVIVPVFVFCCAVPIWGTMMLLVNKWSINRRAWGSATPNPEQWVVYKDNEFKKKNEGKKVPMEKFYEAYFDGEIDIKGDVLEALYHRYDFANMTLTWTQIKFFVTQFIPEAVWHSRMQDKDQVTAHYDRGNDFYDKFLDKDIMIYTSGIFETTEDTLMTAQTRKLDDICRRIQMKEGDKHLDIGCGWGTMVVHAAKNYGSTSTGVTLAAEQVKWAEEKVRQNKVGDKANFLCMDYRDIPKQKFDKITCLEMAEHVGVLRFSKFMNQVYEMLEDDGIFYLQIAGLRRAWQFEDYIWGLFMAKYVFPGADASCPLFFNIYQLEQAGFEVQSVNNIGIHYSGTIKHWYDRWVKPEHKEFVVKKYGERAFREWAWFLGWSVIIAENGNSTCWQIVAYKNRDSFDRKRFVMPRDPLAAKKTQ